MEQEVFICKSWNVRSSQVVNIPSGIRKKLKLDPKGHFLVTSDGQRIIFEPINTERIRKDVEEGNSSPNVTLKKVFSPSSCTPDHEETEAIR